MTEAPSREEIAARIDAAEARTDSKFERLIARIDTANAAALGQIGALDAKIAQLPGKVTFVLTILGTGLAVAAIVASMLSYGGDLFGVGMTVQQAAQAGAEAALAKK